MSYSLNSVKGIILGLVLGKILGLLKRDIRSLDYTSYEVLRVMQDFEYPLNP